MKLVAEFTITMKTVGKNDHPEIRTAAIPVAADTREERDRAFAAIRKMFPNARQSQLTAIAQQEEQPR